MDKILLKFLSDLLYLKGVICFEEFEAIQDASTPNDLDEIFDKMMKEEYNVYKRGEITWEFS